MTENTTINRKGKQIAQKGKSYRYIFRDEFENYERNDW